MNNLNIFDLFSFYYLLARPLAIVIYLWNHELTEHKVTIHSINREAQTVTFNVIESKDWPVVEATADFEAVPRPNPYVTFSFAEDDYGFVTDLDGETRFRIDVAFQHHVLFFFDNEVLSDAAEARFDEMVASMRIRADAA